MFKTGTIVRLDKATAAERRIGELMFALLLGRTRPQMYGRRGRLLIEQTAHLILPWQIGDYEDGE